MFCADIRRVELFEGAARATAWGWRRRPRRTGPLRAVTASVKQRAGVVGCVIGPRRITGRSQCQKRDQRESLATGALEVAQVFEVRLAQRIVVELAREQQRVDMRVEQLAAEIGQVGAPHSVL